MPNDNALLPPTIHLGHLPDERIIDHLARARENIRFAGPGLSAGAARVLAERWQDLGPFAVEVVLDADAGSAGWASAIEMPCGCCWMRPNCWGRPLIVKPV